MRKTMSHVGLLVFVIITVHAQHENSVRMSYTGPETSHSGFQVQFPRSKVSSRYSKFTFPESQLAGVRPNLLTVKGHQPSISVPRLPIGRSVLNNFAPTPSYPRPLSLPYPRPYVSYPRPHSKLSSRFSRYPLVGHYNQYPLSNLRSVCRGSIAFRVPYGCGGRQFDDDHWNYIADFGGGYEQNTFRRNSLSYGNDVFMTPRWQGSYPRRFSPYQSHGLWSSRGSSRRYSRQNFIGRHYDVRGVTRPGYPFLRRIVTENGGNRYSENYDNGNENNRRGRQFGDFTRNYFRHSGEDGEYYSYDDIDD